MTSRSREWLRETGSKNIMAELILTDDEKAAALWTDLDDKVLGAMLRKKIAFLQTAPAQMDKTVATAAGLLLCCEAGEANATEMRMDFDGVTQSGREFGDWLVLVTRKANERGGA